MRTAAESGTPRPRLPRVGGTYALLIRVEEPTTVPVRALGPIAFSEGLYIYLGSAMIGLEGGVSRHLTRGKRTRWHIDYLTVVATPLAVWWVEGEGRLGPADPFVARRRVPRTSIRGLRLPVPGTPGPFPERTGR